MAGKRLRGLKKLVATGKQYDVDEAISLVKRCATSRFDETVELSVNLGIDPKRADQQVRSTVILPQGTGKNVRIIVFAKGEKAREAREAGCELVGEEDLINKVKEGFLDFDVAIATPDMMRSIARLGKILGPRGLMPNPKAGTVTMEVDKAIAEFKKGKIEYRADAYGIVHVPIGKASFEAEKLKENFSVILSSIIKAKPSGAKGQYLKKVHLSTTMGPGIEVNPEAAKRSIVE
jgi:large subunit ribosomal protein L1